MESRGQALRDPLEHGFMLKMPKFLGQVGPGRACPHATCKALTRYTLRKMAMKSNTLKSYKHLKFKQWSITIHHKLQLDEALSVLSDNEAVCIDKDRFFQVQSSESARVFLALINYDGRQERIYVKQFLPRSVLDFIKHLLGDSRGKRAFYASVMLRSSGFHAPAPLCLLQKKFGPFITDNILMTSDVQDAIKLKLKLKDYGLEKTASGLRKKRTLISEFGKLIGKMHQQGIVHGDTRLGNVLVQEVDDQFLFWFIDNENTKRFPRLSTKRVVKNLDQMNIKARVSNTDRLRFMRSYALARDLSRDELKYIAGKVQARTAKRLNKN